MKLFDVVVIGAGVIGHSIAFRLKRLRPRLRIIVLGDPMNSLMASRAAAGMLAPYSECEKADRFFEFCRESLNKYPEFIEELTSFSSCCVSFSAAGSLMPSFLVGDRWDARLKFFQEQKIPYEVWSETQIKKKVPQLAPDCGDVIWVGQGQVNNRQLHDALLSAAHKLGIQVSNGNVTGLITGAGKILKTVTESGDVEGKDYILASGSWSAKLAKILGVSLPIRPIKGQMCRIKVGDNPLDYTISGYLTYIAPWGGGHGFVIGSTMEDRGFDSSIEDKTIYDLIDRASKVLPCLKNAPLIESWAGLRPAAEDQMPIMGKSMHYENLYYSTGHFRNGILQTPNQADYLAGIILDTQKEKIPEFLPDRYKL